MSDDRYDRKELFTKGWGWLMRLAAEAVEKKLDVVPRSHLRPPGALVESLFLTTCDGSGRCVSACPYHAIRLEGASGVHALTTPVLVPTLEPCHMCVDVPCSVVCPSGALAPIRGDQIKMGLAVVDRITCLAWLSSECDRCLCACPVGARAIRRAGGAGPEVFAEYCSGCGCCTSVCPVRPRAIRIRPF